ncbi:MAG: hypothetical protein QM820_54790 [Minicystis sp.]
MESTPPSAPASKRSAMACAIAWATVKAAAQPARGDGGGRTVKAAARSQPSLSGVSSATVTGDSVPGTTKMSYAAGPPARGSGGGRPSAR